MMAPSIGRIRAAVGICAVALAAVVSTVACSAHDLAGGTGGSGGQSAGGVGGGSPVGGAAGGWAGGAAGHAPTGGNTGVSGGNGASCPDPSSCLAGLCGNGVRDTCTQPPGPTGCLGSSFSEECDGHDVAGQTCTDRGYGSGALACSDVCSVDTTGCLVCAAHSPLVVGCAAVPSHAYDWFSMAATDTQTAMVWIDGLTDVAPEVRLTILASNLNVLFDGHIADVVIKPGTGISSKSIQIAALPAGGWVVLAALDDSLTLYALDAAGKVVATSALDSKATPTAAVGVANLVQQPNGGPLVIWELNDGMNALYDAVVSPDGRSVTAPIQVPADPAGTGGVVTLASAVFAAGDFQALMMGCSFDAPCLRVLSIVSDGSVSGSFQVPGEIPGGLPSFGPLLVPSADDVRIIYGADCDTRPGRFCLFAERLSATGAVVSPATQIDSPFPYVGPDSAVALGPETYLAFSQDKSSILVHLSSQDATAGNTLIARGSQVSTTLVRQGSALVAGFFDGDRARLEAARLTP